MKKTCSSEEELDVDMFKEYGNELKDAIENAVLFTCKSMNMSKKLHFFDKNYRHRLKRKMEDLENQKAQAEIYNWYKNELMFRNVNYQVLFRNSNSKKHRDKIPVLNHATDRLKMKRASLGGLIQNQKINTIIKRRNSLEISQPILNTQNPHVEKSLKKHKTLIEPLKAQFSVQKRLSSMESIKSSIPSSFESDTSKPIPSLKAIPPYNKAIEALKCKISECVQYNARNKQVVCVLTHSLRT